MFVHRAPLDQDIRPKRRKRLLEAWRTVDDHELRRLQATFDEIVEKSPPGRPRFRRPCSSPPGNFFGHPAWYAERDQQRDRRRLLSSRTRTTVPSRINRMIGSAASERAFQASQSPFALRQTASWTVASLQRRQTNATSARYESRRQSVPLNRLCAAALKAAQKCTGPARPSRCRRSAWRGWKDVHSGTLCQGQTCGDD